MAYIYNSELSKELIEGARIATAKDNIPTQIADKVVPVMEVNPKLLRRANIIRSANAINSTGATVYTTPTDRDFFLTSVHLSVIKDVTATSQNTELDFVTDDGIQQYAFVINGITLTPQNEVIDQQLNPPIKLKRGTNISLVNGTNVATIRTHATITGYTVD